MNQVSTCPQCGAPIYNDGVWDGNTPPVTVYTCNCRMGRIPGMPGMMGMPPNFAPPGFVPPQIP